jgi:parallel beta-helix repeat protein
MEVIMKKNQTPLCAHQILFTSRMAGICLLAVFSVFTACKKDFPGQHREITVKRGHSIQAAINAASPGTVINVETGTYAEALTIDKAGITIRGIGGEKGAGVIIQNPGSADDGISVSSTGGGFTLENVTVQNFKENGVILTGVDGFRISHVTAINNGEYGIFPIHSTHGLIEYCTASGHADTGLYIGQSSYVEIRNNITFNNVNGIEIENASNIQAEHNESYNNTIGIFADLLPGKDVTVASGILINNNYTHDNNTPNFADPGDLASFIPPGIGVLVLGTDKTVVRDNKVSGNNFSGIIVFSSSVLAVIAGVPPSAMSSIEPNPDGTEIRNNILSNNGTAPPTLPIPLPAVDLLWDGSGVNNCWSGNTFTSAYPSPLPSCN